MPEFKKRKGKYVIRFYDNSRQPKETRETLPIETAIEDVKRTELEMKLAYNKDWDPWRQSWKQYQLKNNPDSMSLTDAIEHHARRCINAHYWQSEKGINTSRSVLERFADYVGPDTPVTMLSEEDIIDFLTYRKLAKSTYNTYLRIIKGLYNRLEREGICTIPVELKQKTIKEDKIKYATLEQLQTMCATFEQRRQRSHKHGKAFDLYSEAWQVMFFMGLRISEILKLKTSDFERGKIRLQRKWHKTVWKDLLPPAKQPFFTLYNAAQKRGDDQLVPRSDPAMRRQFKKVRDEAFGKSESDLTPHSLRHGCATFWLSQGVNIQAVKDLMDHEKLSTTYKYAKLLPEYKTSEFRDGWQRHVESISDTPESATPSESSEAGVAKADWDMTGTS